MSHSPLMRYLGLEDGAGDRALLGLHPDVQPTATQVEAALEARLARLHRHPNAKSASAGEVEEVLNKASLRLLQRIRGTSTPPKRPTTIPAPEPAISKPPSSPKPPPALESKIRRRAAEAEKAAAAAKEAARVDERRKADQARSESGGTSGPSASGPTRPGTGSVAGLTDFDRTILAILVGSGGWNAASRGRLIGLAASRGLKPAALLRIVRGLATLLHGGGFESLSGAPRAIDVALPPPPVPRAPTRMESRMNQISEVLASEFRGDTSGARMRLGIICSVLAIILVGLFVGLLMLPSPAIEQARQKAKESEARQAIIDAAEARVAADRERQAPGRRSGGFLPGGDGMSDVPLVIPARWDEPPTFQADRRPTAEVLRSHDAPIWITEMSALARKASLPQASASASLVRNFEATLGDAGRCWPLLDPSIRGRLVTAITDPVSTSASSELREKLLRRIDGQLLDFDEPLDVWRASWAAGLFGVITVDPLQPESARILASELLSMDLGPRRRTRELGEDPFSVAAGRKLDALVPALFELTRNEQPRAHDAWELWIEAQRSVRSGALLEVALLDAVMVVLEEGAAFDRPGMQVELLGRLLSELDFSPRAHDTELMKMNLRSWFESADITSDNLWALGSLLASSIDVPWWDGRHVPSPTATMSERMAMADRIIVDWPQRLPTERPRGIPVPGDLLDRLEGLQAELANRSMPEEQVDVLAALVDNARLTAAAEAFENGDLEAGAEFLLDVETGVLTPYAPTGQPESVVGPIGASRERDGVWTEQWNRLGRDLDERQAHLRRLKQRTDGDLGIVDAQSLVYTAYRGIPREIRLLAQEVVVDSFPMGPNVALALLDQFEYAPLNQETVDFLKRFTVDPLPALSDKSWRETARLAMARHAFEVHQTVMHDVDTLINTYATILRDRFELLGGEAYLRDADPEEIASALVSLIERRATGRFVSDPIPAPLAELERRRGVRWASADGSAQQLASELSALVDLATYESSSLRPDQRRQLVERHAELTARVAVSPNVLQQILLLEQALGELIIMRLEAARMEESG